MKQFRYLIIAGIITLFFSTALKAQQPKKFAKETDAFLEQLSDFVLYNASDEAEDILQRFTESITIDSVYTTEELQNIIEQCNQLLDKKGRANPHFVLLLELHNTFKPLETKLNNYNTWQQALMHMLNKRKYKLREVQDFFEAILLLEKRSILHESSSVTWQATNAEYTFVGKDPMVVKIEQTNLVCYAKRDSMHIYNTSGTFKPISKKWDGNTGMVTWERGGYSRDTIYANLQTYNINLERSQYEADSVKFINTMYFDSALYGTLYDKVTYIKNKEDANHPKFQTYQKNFYIEDLYPDITYAGGLSMEGAQLIGRGTRENPANIYIYQNDTLLVNTRSTYFAFKHDRVLSPSTAVSILVENDSIFHPDLFFTYRISKHELTLLKTDSYTSQGPYFNSYHKVDMNFEQLYWNIKEPVMYFTAQRGASIGNANFESINLFDKQRFDKLFGMDYIHPLTKVRSFVEKNKSREFTAQQYADYTAKPIYQVRHLLMELSYYGFIFYDVNTDEVQVKERLYDYIKADAGMKDYDVINFQSTTRLPLENAAFNTQNFDLTINGIPEVKVSDQQAVQIMPRADKIVLKRNRNFQFDGVVQAGLATFFGKNFFFHYDSFKINLQDVDSMALNYITGKKDNYGLDVISTIKNKIEHITGEIYIDSSDNKAGIKDYPIYPLFRSNENSYVFYNKPYIQEGVYTADQFYFELESFVMDSLDNFMGSGIEFIGTLYSADIFPPIPQKLVLQKDESLGFHHKTGPEGLPAYTGKGNYYNTIHLSNAGLKGDGNLEYLTSVTTSNEFIFLPDSMNAFAEGFQIKQKTTPVEYPRVKSSNNYVHWEPYNDVMLTDKTDTKFNMFNDSTHLDGAINLTPTGLTAMGLMDLKNSEIRSDHFEYKAYDIIADTSDFYLKSLHNDGFTVLTNNVNTHINYRNRKGYFTSNEDFTLVDFPENRYVSYLDYFVWHMMDYQLEMGAKNAQHGQEETYTREDGIEPEGPRYISVHPKQDSLNFVSPLAFYDYDKNLINAEQVKFVRVADARIYPFDDKLSIAENARMLTLDSAVIIANEEREYHRIFDASLVVNSRSNYEGRGKYNYIDQNNDVQTIKLHEIKVDTGMNTVARGEIIEPDNFTLSPVYLYQGDVTLYAKEQFLLFDGAVKMDHTCEKIPSRWLAFETHIDPLNIYIPISNEMMDINRQDIYTGPYVYYDSVHIYPTFFTGRKNYNDTRIASAEGYLFYNQANRQYQIGSKARASRRDLHRCSIQ